MIVEKHVKVPAGFGSNHLHMFFFFFVWVHVKNAFQNFLKPRFGMIFASPAGEFAAGFGNVRCMECPRGQYQDTKGQGPKVNLITGKHA